MNVSVVELSSNQKKLLVEIPAGKVQKEIEEKYRDLAKRVKIKGFRPGKIPRNILKSYYGKSIENEVSSQFIQDTFPDALREVNVKPLVEADISETRFDDNGAFTYAAIVEVCPPFEVEGYKGLEVQRPPIQSSEQLEEAELERIRQQHSQLRTLESNRPIQDGDVALIDFTPWVDGAIFEKGKTNDQMVEVGKRAIHPDLDGHLIGRLVGDSFSVDLDYPENAQTPEIAGKRVRMDVVIREIKEKIVPELNDEFAKEVGSFETLEALKQAVREQLQKREEGRVASEVRQQIVDLLLSKVELDLTSKVTEREIDRLIGMLQQQFESQGLRIDTSKFNTPEIRVDYKPQAEKNVRWRLIHQQVAKQEHIELTEEETEEVYREVARYARMDVEELKRDYADGTIVEQAKESRLQEKVMKFLEDAAVYIDAPVEGTITNQE